MFSIFSLFLLCDIVIVLRGVSMVDSVIETERLILRRMGYDKNGLKLTDKARKKEVLSVFKSWSNPQNYRYNEITWDIDDVDEMFDYDMPTEWGMHYMVVELKETGKVVATCRFGIRYDDETNTAWDFGYNVFRGDDKETYTLDEVRSVFKNDGLKKDELYQGKGYAKEILNTIMNVARKEGVKKLYAGADIDNFASIKVMMKNGFEFDCIDEDGDPCMECDLTRPNINLTSQEIDDRWNGYLKVIREKREELLDVVKENYNNQYSNALVYYFLGCVAREYNEIKIEQELMSLNNADMELLINGINKIETRWKKRLLSDSNDERLLRHLSYINRLKDISNRNIQIK